MGDLVYWASFGQIDCQTIAEQFLDNCKKKRHRVFYQVAYRYPMGGELVFFGFFLLFYFTIFAE